MDKVKVAKAILWFAGTLMVITIATLVATAVFVNPGAALLMIGIIGLTAATFWAINVVTDAEVEDKDYDVSDE